MLLGMFCMKAFLFRTCDFREENGWIANEGGEEIYAEMKPSQIEVSLSFNCQFKSASVLAVTNEMRVDWENYNIFYH